MNIDILEIQKTMEKELPKKRFFHTLGVAHTAVCLSMRYKADYKKAHIAGLLHDCAKCIEDRELLKRCLLFEIPVTETEKASPSLLHGKLGAYYCKTRFGIEDEDILNAVSYHTTGRPSMSLLEKIIFIADYVEPGRREISGLWDIRNIVFDNLNQAVLMVLENTINYLKDKESAGITIDRMSIDAYNYYKLINENGKETI